jgi:hypothetical protein
VARKRNRQLGNQVQAFRDRESSAQKEDRRQECQIPFITEVGLYPLNFDCSTRRITLGEQSAVQEQEGKELKATET